MNIEEIKIKLGSKIKAVRINKGYTQEQFCAKINLEQPNLSNIENGKTLPDILTLCAIIKNIEVEPNYLFDFLLKNNQIFENLDYEIIKIIQNLPLDAKENIKKVLELTIK